MGLKRNGRFIVGVVALAGVGIAHPANGMSSNVLFEIESEIGWRFMPAIEDGSVIGFLAEHTGDPLGPNAFDVIWYARSGDTFTMSIGWTGAPIEVAAAEVAFHFVDVPTMFEATSLGETIADLHDLCCQVSGPDVPLILGEPVEFGFAATDPFQAVLSELHPEHFDHLIVLGGAGAPGLSGSEIGPAGLGSTPASAKLLYVAQWIEAALIDPFDPVPPAQDPELFCWPMKICTENIIQAGPWHFLSQTAGGCCRYTRTVTVQKYCVEVDFFCNVTPWQAVGSPYQKQDPRRCCGSGLQTCPPVPNC